MCDHTGSNILCNVIDQRALLGILCSTAARYSEKAFINRGVHAQLDELPIALPSAEQSAVIIEIVDAMTNPVANPLSFTSFGEISIEVAFSPEVSDASPARECRMSIS